MVLMIDNYDSFTFKPRYHALVVERATLPGCLAVTARSEHGREMLQNFIQGERP